MHIHHVYTHMHSYIHTRTHTHTHVHTHVHTHTCTHICTHTFAHTFSHTRARTHTCTHTHTHTHTNTHHTYTPIHMHTQSSPRPPDVIYAENVTCCSANISWNIPQFEIESNIEYIAQISSGCANSTQEKTGLSQRWYVFTELCCETSHTVAIRVFDTDSNFTGYYGPAYAFQTLSGTPAAPRDVSLIYGGEGFQSLEVYWGVPGFSCGTIRMYEIQWSNSSRSNGCNNPDGRVLSFNQTDTSMKTFKTFNTGNVNVTRTILVCVRAYTSFPQPGPWEFDFKENIISGNVDANTQQCECSGLVAVAVVAGFAVLSSILMTVILIVVIVKKCPTRLCGYSGDDKDSLEKPYVYNGTRPPFDTMMSTGSASSTSPFFPNSIK